MSDFLARNMDFLHALAQMRTPLLDTVMALVTHLGEETVFMVVLMTVFWCIDKRRGYYLMMVGLAGTVLNQTLKIMMKIPRPWVLDPEFEIVERARAQATGYSFPSGHTQNAIGTFGCLAVTGRRRWLRVACVVAAALVAFSRLYLGVHTPFDVGVSILAAGLLVAVFYPVYRAMEEHPGRFVLLWLFLIAATFGFLNYARTQQMLAVSAGTAEEALANFASAVKNAYSMLGASIGGLIVFFADEKKLHFETKAVWWAQILKTALGLALVVAIKTALKAPLYALLGPAGDTLRYGVIILFAGIVWPLSFRWFAGLPYPRKR